MRLHPSCRARAAARAPPPSLFAPSCRPRTPVPPRFQAHPRAAASRLPADGAACLAPAGPAQRVGAAKAAQGRGLLWRAGGATARQGPCARLGHRTGGRRAAPPLLAGHLCRICMCSGTLHGPAARAAALLPRRQRRQPAQRWRGCAGNTAGVATGRPPVAPPPDERPAKPPPTAAVRRLRRHDGALRAAGRGHLPGGLCRPQLWLPH